MNMNTLTLLSGIWLADLLLPKSPKSPKSGREEVGRWVISLLPWQPPIVSNLIYSQSKQKHQLVLNSVRTEREVCVSLRLWMCLCTILYWHIYIYIYIYICVCVNVCVCVVSPGMKLPPPITHQSTSVNTQPQNITAYWLIYVCMCALLQQYKQFKLVNSHFNSFSQHLTNQWPHTDERVIWLARSPQR